MRSRRSYKLSGAAARRIWGDRSQSLLAPSSQFESSGVVLKTLARDRACPSLSYKEVETHSHA